MTESRPADPRPFDLSGPLPVGCTVLEASAGTGKTYAIAALTARFVCELGVPIGAVLVATFGRMATDELRTRLRQRLIEVEDALAGRADGDGVTAAILAAVEPAVARERVRAALADFDGATVTTTHDFAGQMLAALGVLGDHEPGARFVESLSDLTTEVATDCYLRRFAASESLPSLDLAEAEKIARDVVEFGHTELVPAPGPDDRGPWVDRAGFAGDVRDEVARRKARAQLYSYEDLLTRLQRALADPVWGADAAGRLRDRFRVVLIDEFQDTDPIQWDILRRAFGDGLPLVLIGDPKQAIYAFRGADVFSYLDAVTDADDLATLATNHRSDADLVRVLQALWGGRSLGPGITVREVRAAHDGSRLTGPADRTRPVRLRVLRTDPEQEKLPSVRALRPQIVADLVADVRRTLDGTLQLPDREGTRRVVPRDIAVLVHKNSTGEQVSAALSAAGVPAVMIGAASVFAQPMAGEWLTLLRALERPRSALIRQVALTCFVGWSLQRLATAAASADGEALTELTQRVRGWARTLQRHGVAALVETVTGTGLTARLLGAPGGERTLTDLRHIGQLLHHAAVRDQLGVAALTDWLRDRMREVAGSTVGERTRRLDTEADAVTVLTVHRSKGLQWPVVYLPELWDRWIGDDDGQVLQLHAPTDEGGLAAVLDVGGSTGPGRAERRARQRAESAAEDLRLGYVALTRAQSQVVTWWAPSANTEHSALQRFLYAEPGGEPAPHPVDGDPDERATAAGIAVETVLPVSAVAVEVAAPVPIPRLAVRRFDRSLDLEWRRTSYSGLTAAAHGLDPAVAGVGSEALGPEDDEVAPTPEPVAAEGGPDREASPMAGLPGGTRFGSTVHDVLERFDPDRPDGPAALRDAVAESMRRWPAGPEDAIGIEELATALWPSLTTPLGPLAVDRSLAELPSADRLAELSFELPLAGGDRPASATATLADVADLLADRLAPGDPLAGYPDRLRSPLLAEQTLRGYLVGSIDAVLRIRGDVSPAYLIVDYKTNVLGEAGPDHPLTLAGYRPDRLAEAMMGSHYPLQALLYQVALHRFLRWRQPGYDPAIHLGGVLYLYLRGMAGPEAPRVGGVPYGVFSWRPPAAVAVGLSELLDRGAR